MSCAGQTFTFTACACQNLCFIELRTATYCILLKVQIHSILVRILKFFFSVVLQTVYYCRYRSPIVCNIGAIAHEVKALRTEVGVSVRIRVGVRVRQRGGSSVTRTYTSPDREQAATSSCAKNMRVCSVAGSRLHDTVAPTPSRRESPLRSCRTVE